MALPVVESVAQPGPSPTKETGSQSYLVPFILVTSLFFLWGMAHNLDSILIPHLRKACQLSNRQSTLVDTAVFFAYFILAIPAGIMLKRWGYKAGIIVGLSLFATGAFLFVPAANALSFPIFLTALFIIGCGLAILETAANPYAVVLGSPSEANFRINLAQAFNGLSVVIAPYVGKLFILSGKEYTPDQLNAMTEANRVAYLAGEAASVKMPYIVLGIVLVSIALLFFVVKLPEMKDDTKIVKPSDFKRAFRYKHLTWAVIAQFFYVGAQVCVTSFFIRLAKQASGMGEKDAADILVIYGVIFMIGRFTGTALLKIVQPARLLAIFSVASIALSIVAIYSSGLFVLYSLCALGFFMSIMFPTIFGLGLEGLGADTKIGASLLVMSIVGGAIIPYLMGSIIDASGDHIQTGYWVPAVCYAIILYFALSGYKVKKAVA